MSVFHARIPGSLHFTHAYPVSQHSAHAYPMLTSPCIAYWSYVGTLSRPYLMKKTGSGSVVYVIIILNGAIKTKYTPPPHHHHHHHHFPIPLPPHPHPPQQHYFEGSSDVKFASLFSSNGN